MKRAALKAMIALRDRIVAINEDGAVDQAGDCVWYKMNVTECKELSGDRNWYRRNIHYYCLREDEPDQTFTANASNNQLSLSGVAPENGTMVQVSSDGTLPAPLQADVEYYVNKVDASTIRLLTSKENATVVDITDTGSGTHSLHLEIAKIQEEKDAAHFKAPDLVKAALETYMATLTDCVKYTIREYMSGEKMGVVRAFWKNTSNPNTEVDVKWLLVFKDNGSVTHRVITNYGG